MNADDLHKQALSHFHALMDAIECDRARPGLCDGLRQSVTLRGLDRIGFMQAQSPEDLHREFGTILDSDELVALGLKAWKSIRLWVVARDEGVDAALIWKLTWGGK